MQVLFGTKLGMTSTYDSRGRRVGATMLKVEPNLVTQIKTTDSKDGYNSVQLGYSEKKSVKKPQIGHLKKAGIEKKVRWLREVRLVSRDSSLATSNEKPETSNDLKPGQEITLNQVFSVGDAVKVTGVSKGRGFAGGVKRHGFHGGPKTHGQSDRHRAPGSIGAGTTPGRVYKGKHMAGHMGVDKVSYRGLEVVGLNKAENVITIKGGVPGPIGGLIRIENIGKIKGYTPPPEEKPEEEENDQAETVIPNGSEESLSLSENPTSVGDSSELETPQNDNVEGEENANS